MNQMTFEEVEPAFKFRKADPPTIGPAIDQKSNMGAFFEAVPGSMSLMFDTSKLTLADYNNMRVHPQVHASLSLMTFMIHQADWSIECKDKKVADTIEDNMRKIWTQLVRGIATGYWAGYAPNVLEWDNVAGPRSERGELDSIYITKVKDLNPIECAVNWKEVESSFRPRPEDLVTGQEFNRSSIPKVKIYDGIKKFGLQYPIPPDNTFWYPVLMEYGNHYGRKLLEPAFMPWYFSILIHLYANRYFERFGEPTPVGRAPLDQDFEYREGNQTVKVSSKQAMEQIINSLRSSGKVILPSDRDESASNNRSEYLWDLEYLESEMRGADFDRYLERLDEEISLAIFTPMLLMRSGDKGSLNLGVQHTQTWLWSLNAMMGDLKSYIDRYIVNRIRAFNFNQNVPDAYWMPRAMGKDNSETLRAMISQLIQGGMAKPDLDELGTALGMTIQEIREAAPDPTLVDGDTRNRGERSRTEDGPRTVGDDLPATTSQ